MNMLTLLAQIEFTPTTGDIDLYLKLVVAVPIIIALMLVVLVMMAFSLVGVQSWLQRINRLLEDVFYEKLAEVDAENAAFDRKESAERIAARKDRKEALELELKKHKNRVWVLFGIAAVLSLVLIFVLLYF